MADEERPYVARARARHRSPATVAPAGILKENGRPPSASATEEEEEEEDGDRRQRLDTVTFEDEIANDDDDENRARGGDDSPPRARRRVDIPAAMRRYPERRPAGRRVSMASPPRASAAALPRRLERAEPTAREPASASRHLRASRGGCSRLNRALTVVPKLRVVTGAAACSRRETEGDGDRSHRDSVRPAELTDLPEDPKPLTAGAAGAGCRTACRRSPHRAAREGWRWKTGTAAAAKSGSRGKSKRSQGGDDDGTVAGLADFRDRTRRRPLAGGDAAREQEGDHPRRWRAAAAAGGRRTF